MGIRQDTLDPLEQVVECVSCLMSQCGAGSIEVAGMDAGNDPGFERGATGVGTEYDEMFCLFDDPLMKSGFAVKDLAKDALFLA